MELKEEIKMPVQEVVFMVHKKHVEVVKELILEELVAVPEVTMLGRLSRSGLRS